MTTIEHDPMTCGLDEGGEYSTCPGCRAENAPPKSNSSRARPTKNKRPPWSESSEKSVLGAMIRDNSVIDDVAVILRVQNFYADHNQKVYLAIRKLYDKGKPVDLVLLANALKASGDYDRIGRAAYLAELWECAPTGANAEHYARIVKDMATYRDLIVTGNEIARDAQDCISPAPELVESAERRIFALAENGEESQFVDMAHEVQPSLDWLAARKKGNQRRPLASTCTAGVV